MKKLLSNLLLLSIIGCLTSCHTDLDPQEAGNYRSHKNKEKNVLKTIRMNFGGDYISESDEPLLRAEDGDTYTAINVFRTEKDAADAREEKYAYGLFKKKDGIDIDVLTGYTYRFEATILIEREDKVFAVNSSYADPFSYWTDKEGKTSKLNYASDRLGKFKYTSTHNGNQVADDMREYFRQLAVGTTHVDTGGELESEAQGYISYAAVSYPRIKRFYGGVSTFDPGIAQAVEIPMAYKCFGLKIEVVGLPSGYVTVKDISKKSNNVDKEPRERLVFPKGLQLSNDGTKEWEGLYSMNNLLAESETFTLRFTWHKGGDVTENFSTEVTVKPKTRKILRLNINGSPNYETKGNISFSMESEALTDEIQDATHDF